MKFRLQSNTFSGDYKAEAAVYADSYDELISFRMMAM